MTESEIVTLRDALTRLAPWATTTLTVIGAFATMIWIGASLVTEQHDQGQRLGLIETSVERILQNQTHDEAALQALATEQAVLQDKVGRLDVPFSGPGLMGAP